LLASYTFGIPRECNDRVAATTGYTLGMAPDMDIDGSACDFSLTRHHMHPRHV